MPAALFVHNGSPGRFAFLGKALIARGWECVLINGPSGTDIEGARTLRWSAPKFSAQSQFGPARKAESDIVAGYSAAMTAEELAASGFRPDIIIGHPGWGEMLFLKEAFPDTPQIQIGEFYYHSRGADCGFDTEFEPEHTMQWRTRIRAKNASLAMSYLDAARIVCPTPFQASLLPPALCERIAVIHEGIDTQLTRRIDEAQITLPSGVVLSRDAPVVTFINRFFEPLRGFHVFMRALPEFLAQAPNAHVLLIGSDQPRGYGAPAPNGRTWKQVLLEEVGAKLDPARVHFVGQMDYTTLLNALSLSAAHVYLTYPFVLSWSLLDAMACEGLIVASDTAPVRDVIGHNQNGLLVDFFDHKALAAQLAQACAQPARFTALRQAARATVVERFNRDACLSQWLALIEETRSTRDAPPREGRG